MPFLQKLSPSGTNGLGDGNACNHARDLLKETMGSKQKGRGAILGGKSASVGSTSLADSQVQSYNLPAVYHSLGSF